MQNKNVLALVQARVGASRLPNKMLLCLNGYPIVEWVYRRVLRSQLIDNLVFAIPDTERDDILDMSLKRMGASVFRGNETDVVSRFHGAAKAHNASHIVRVCADNPLVCPDEIDNLIKFYFSHTCDYAYNHVPRNNQYPDGLGAEMVSMGVLEKIYLEAKSAAQREHVFNYIWDNSDGFAIKTFDPPDKEIAYPSVRVDIDSYEDYKRFLGKDVRIDMSAREIVSMFRSDNK